jgi:hypothetical protein
MSLVAKANSQEFEKFPLPDEGTVQAVCVGIWDIGEQVTPFIDEKTGLPKSQHKVVIAWEINQMINAPESEYHGKPYMLSKTYTVSLGEKSNLRHDLESWRGKPFTESELKDGFDLEKLYGVNCLVGVTHVTKNDRTFANITSILPPLKGMERMIPVRAKDDPAPKWVLEKMAQASKPPVENQTSSTDNNDSEAMPF